MPSPGQTSCALQNDSIQSSKYIMVPLVKLKSLQSWSKKGTNKLSTYSVHIGPDVLLQLYVL